MNLDDLRQLLDMVREHDLIEFELEQDGVRLRIRKDSVQPVAALQALHGAMGLATPLPAVMAGLATSAPAGSAGTAPGDGADPGEDAVELAVVKAPIVGTFYRASAPGAPAFVDIGTAVRKGQVLCIIEAMKLMNEIESEYDGEVVKVYVENGQPVQYGERLFAIRAAS
jgi:acetyl-CoA carboxylase biotin carboxyl carrier protein